MEALTLQKGVDSPTTTPEEKERRIKVLRATMEKYLPDFIEAMRVATASAMDDGNRRVNAQGRTQMEILLHQDSFAYGYDVDEYTLLGMAIKYAGLYGVTVRIIGGNQES